MGYQVIKKPFNRSIIAVEWLLARFKGIPYSNKDLAIPISSPLNSANPLRRPMQEYPGLVFFFKSSTIW